ncbi:hypothetical protein RI367_003792 [Sorochytrium milnesiophthora]
MTDSGASSTPDIEELRPCVPYYGLAFIRGLKPGEKKRWCTCGLSAKQPWCDNSHIGTPFKPLLWTVPDKQQSGYSICNCKYTKNPPYCDSTHVSCPVEVVRRQEECREKDQHEDGRRMCWHCGWRNWSLVSDDNNKQSVEIETE